MENIKLSEHFKLFEFCNTSSGKNVIQANREFASKEENIKKLSILSNEILEPIRAELIKKENNFNCKVLIITSGVRTSGTRIANASATSQHNHCEACDFVVDGTLENTLRLYRLIKERKIANLNYDLISQCILERKKRTNGTYSAWIHIAIKTDRFIKQRQKANRNYSKFPEFFTSLDGFNYVLSTEANFKKYVEV